MGEHAESETSNGKGKGKQVATPEPDHEPATGQNDDSIISRVTQSAVGLTRSLLSGTPATDTLGSITSTGKAAPSSSKAPSAGESSVAYHRPEVDSAGSFRSTHTDAHIAAEKSAFSDFLDSTDVFIPTEPVGLHNTLVSDVVPGGSNALLAQPAPQSLTSVEQQQSRDGEDVVQLLASNSDVLDYDADVMISEAELPKLREALFGEDAESRQSSTDWDNILNFIPEFLQTSGDGNYSTSAAEQQNTLLGTSDPVEAGQVWLEQWNRVLTSYTDEVWGDLDALVRKAREEVKQLEEAQPGEPPPETKAFRRLRQILGHIRG